MSDIKALVGQFLQNPQSVTSLIKDPKALAKAAGVNEQQLSLISGIGSAVSGLLSRAAAKPASPALPAAEIASQPSSSSPASNSNGSTAVVGIVSLAAVTGAIAVLGTVTAVALGNASRKQTP